MRTLLLLVLLVASVVPVRASGLKIGLSCLNPCGEQTVVQGGPPALCDVVLTNTGVDGSTLLIQDARVRASHADGTDTQVLLGTNVVLAPAQVIHLAASVTAHPGDLALAGHLLPLEAIVDHHVCVGALCGPSLESFVGDVLTVIPVQACFGGATTTTTTTTTTTMARPSGPPWGNGNGCGPFNPGCHKK